MSMLMACIVFQLAGMTALVAACYETIKLRCQLRFT